MSTVIISLAVLFFLGHALNWFFAKSKIPDLLILVLLGYLIGPILGIVNPADLGKVGGIVATVTLIVILYEGGLHLRTRDLLTSSLPALGLSTIGFFLIALAGTLVARMAGLDNWLTASLVGIGIGSTSSAIVIPMVKHLSIQGKTKTILSLESAFTDVIAIVLFLAVVDAITSGHYSAQNLLLGIGSQPIISIAMGVLAGLLWALIKKLFAPVFSMAFAGEAWALLTYGLIEAFSMNGALGVLALGFTLANLNLLPSILKEHISSVPVSYNDLSLLSELTLLLRTFFFIYLGILVQLGSIYIVLMAMLLCLAILVTRYATIYLVLRPRTNSRVDAMVATAMGPRGLACAVLATIPMQRGIAGGEFMQNLMFAIVLFSIFFTAVFVILSENAQFRQKMEKFFARYPENGKDGAEEKEC